MSINLPSRRIVKQLASNILMWILIGAMAVIGLIAYYTYRAYQNAATELLVQRDRQLAQLSAARLSSEMNNFSSILIDIARTADMFSGDLPDQFRAFQSAAPRLAVFDGGSLLLDGRGIVIAAQPPRPTLIGEDFSKREYYRAVLGTSPLHFSDGVADGPQGQTVIGVAVPIEGPQEQLVGVIVGYFEIGQDISNSFYSSLVRLRLGQTGAIYLFDGQARILFDSGTDSIGHFLTTSQLTQVSELRQAGSMLFVDENGRETVAALAPVPNTDWTIVIEDDWRQLTSSTRRYANIFFLSLFLGLLLPPISIVVLSRQRKIRKLFINKNPSVRELSTLVQNSIAPSTLPMLPNWEIAVRQIDSEIKQISTYDATILADGRLLLMLAESDGPQLPASLALRDVHAVMRAAAEQNTISKESLQQCNRLLLRSQKETTIRSIYLTLDPTEARFQYCAAGQAPPVISDQISTWQNWVSGPSQPLGENPEAAFMSGSGTLAKGQILLLASQHALEAKGANGEIFLDEVIVDILEQPPDDLNRLANMLMAEYRGFRKALNSPSPPMTLILLQHMKDRSAKV